MDKYQRHVDEPGVAEATVGFCQKKHRALANGCTTRWGGSGEGAAKALDLIFSPSAPGCALPAKLRFYCHKGCIHLNWKKYVGKNSGPDSRAKELSLISPSNPFSLLDFKKPLTLCSWHTAALFSK